ncbi:Folylpolyglutamate synthase [Penicillium subrubescens]|uniref:Folylpolyglutamate synthase n=1 Tax=Penicillium subrubescens TaxID=1316194 RepID=UPI002545A8F1|nr:Folylpolyglutamate synthase [Penicillium subrubescens]KAJ5873644.1 Folylpolyglutamate synthase [Penicillium subrubescens]
MRRAWRSLQRSGPQRRELTRSPVMARSYEAAIAKLNSLQTSSATVQELRKTTPRKDMNMRSLPETVEWLRRIGHKPSDLDLLNLVHIAGTKGKGSTSAFISSILSQYTRSEPGQSSPRLHKVGLYTSPHLLFVRERIKIDNVPLSEKQFAQYFFEVWDLLEDAAKAAGEDPLSAKPRYFRYLTLMAFHTYLREGVDATIVECGVGGEYDCTNVIEQPKVTAITSLGIDHTLMLGPTIEDIAWHKGGIMKSSARAFTAPQDPNAQRVLAERAAAKGIKLDVVVEHPELRQVKLGLNGDFQYTNASVAVAVANEFLRRAGVPEISDNIMADSLPAKFKTGLEETRLGGRCETRSEKNVAWYIDGAHTLESIHLAGQWFASHIDADSSSDFGMNKLRILIFNQQTRDSPALARALHETLAAALESDMPFTHALFCTNITYKLAGVRPDFVSMNTNADDVELLRVQKCLAAAWNEIDHNTETQVFSTIEEAVDFVRDLAERNSVQQGGVPVMAFVTGSIHLVGGFLDVIETKTYTEDVCRENWR